MKINFLKSEKVKRWLKIVVFLFVVIQTILFSLGYTIDFLEKRAEDKYYAEMQRPYLEDTYGGATPEETFEMFLTALKAGDIDLASKYFIVDKQASRQEYFQAVVEAGNMEEMIEDLSGEMVYDGSLYENDERYAIKIKGEIIFDSINFMKYPSGVWKIKEL